MNKLPNILVKGYINQYSQLNKQELRQLGYRTLYKQINPAWDESMVFLSKYIKRHAKKKFTVLDAGCGNGNYVLDENIDLSFKITGLDTSAKHTSKNITCSKILYGNLEKIPFKDNYFDLVTSLWVLEHLERPTEVFNEIARVLKPKGIFIFVTTNKNFYPIWAIRKFKIVNWFINNYLFGRSREDIFKTYYKANTLDTIYSISKSTYNTKNLMYNYDPSYTSFNNTTFKLSNLLGRSLKPSITYAHIVQNFASLNFSQ